MTVKRNMAAESGGSVTSLRKGRLAVLGLVSAGLVACGGFDMKADLPQASLTKAEPMSVTALDRRVWQVNRPGGLRGFVVADEPQAAEVGRQILAGGGNAADAAVATYFALSATYSGAAGLGGGGACLYRDGKGGSVVQLDFPVKPAKSGGKVGVPGNVRGFSWLHIERGSMAWSDLVDPAARLAGGGAIMSDATHGQMEANRSLRWPPRGLYENGDIVAEGRIYRQGPLATTLGALQGGRAASFYNGDLGKIFVAESLVSDSTLTMDDMRDYQVAVSRAKSMTSGEKSIFTRAGNEVENSVWQSAVDGSKPAETELNSLRSSDAGSTSFVTVDRDGNAAACIVSMNGAFGFGDVSRTTGIYFSAAQDNTSLSNMAIVTGKKGDLLYAAASGGGASGLQKSAATLSEVALGTSTLAQSLQVNQNSGFDHLNAVHCKGGLDQQPKSCQFGTEPTSNGYGLMAK